MYYQDYEDTEDYSDPGDYDLWYGYEDEADGEWIYEYDDGQETDSYGSGDGVEASWNGDPPTAEHDNGASARDDMKEEYYKGKGKSNDGCYNCGSKWHLARDCPMAKGAGKKGSGKKGKGTWRAVWRPRFKGSGKGKGKYRKGFGKSFGKKGKGKGKNHWYFGPKFQENVKAFPVDFSEGVPDHTTARSSTSQRVLFQKDKLSNQKNLPEKHIIHTSSEEDDFMSRRKPSTSTTIFTATSAENNLEEETSKPSKQHSFNFPTLHNTTMDGQYFAVRGEKRHGLLIDPGAASGLVGSDTLLQLLEHCSRPAGNEDEMVVDRNKVVPVSGINGVSESTLGQVTLPLTSGGHPITYTADVLGGDGSFCPALVGNPALREMNAVICANWFQNGDGLILVGAPSEDAVHHRMFRLLLTDSGHYMLPTDHDNTARVSSQTKRDVVLFCAKAAAKSMEMWKDVHPRVHHCFLSHVARQANGDRGEDNLYDNKINHKNAKDQNESPENKVDSHHGGPEAADQAELSTRPSLLPPDGNLDTKNAMNIKLKKVHFEEDNLPDSLQPPVQQHDSEPKLKGDSAVLMAEKKPVSLLVPNAQEDRGTSSHDIDKHNVLEELDYKSPAEPKVSHEEAILANNNTKAILATDDEATLANDDGSVYATWTSEPYVEDHFPDNVDEAKLKKRYKAIPEEYYTKSGFHPVTPQNFKSWFAKAKGRGLRWHAWELCSGSGRLSLVLLLAGLVVGFPVDYRYGWNINDPVHQKMLSQAQREFRPISSWIHSLCPGLCTMVSSWEYKGS
eukprot:s113_g30.t1